jgi:hypothetical protein
MSFLPKTVLFCALCAVSVSNYAQDNAPIAEPAAAPPAVEAEAAPADTTTSTLPGNLQAPPEGMGQIVFFRPSKFVGAAIGYKVRENEVELGKLANGTYFVHTTQPGPHAYVVHSEAKDILNIEVEAGETYYVVGGVTMGVLAGRPNLSPSDQNAFAEIAAKLKPAKPLKPKK